nr:MAG TPA: hypothetical protein [Caudoviricetes sp.]
MALIMDTLNLYQYSHLIDIQVHHNILVIRDLVMCLKVMAVHL